MEEDGRLQECAIADPQDHYGAREQLLQTLERVLQRYRTALLPYHGEGYGYMQLAKVLGISPTEAAAKMFLSRARRCFR